MTDISEILSQIVIEDAFFGAFHYAAGATYGPRTQEHLELVVAQQGGYALTLDGEARVLPPQHISLQWPGHLEHFQFPPGGATYLSWCSFSAPAGLEATLGPLPFCLPLSTRLETLIRLGLSLGTEEQLYSKTLRNHLATCIFWDFVQSAQSWSSQGQASPPALQRVHRFVAEHYGEPLELSDLAAAAYLSPSQLARLFDEHLGTTPMHHLWHVRCEAGLQLLRDTGLAIAEIAHRTGFKTPAHFSRKMKARYSYAPSALRQRYQQSRRRQQL